MYLLRTAIIIYILPEPALQRGRVLNTACKARTTQGATSLPCQCPKLLPALPQVPGLHAGVEKEATTALEERDETHTISMSSDTHWCCFLPTPPSLFLAPIRVWNMVSTVILIMVLGFCNSNQLECREPRRLA